MCVVHVVTYLVSVYHCVCMDVFNCAVFLGLFVVCVCERESVLFPLLKEQFSISRNPLICCCKDEYLADDAITNLLLLLGCLLVAMLHYHISNSPEMVNYSFYLGM